MYSNDIYQCNGFLWIGDPQIDSHENKPSRRLDVNYLETGCNKLEQAIDIANSKDLIPVILGDLTEQPYLQKNSLFVFNQIYKVLSKAKHKPIVLVGNHDCTQTIVSDDTFMGALRQAGVIHCYDDSGLIGYFWCNNKTVALGGTAYWKGYPPDDVSHFVNVKHDLCIWLSHQDVGFDNSSYPGVKKAYPIKGCDMVINGHMHMTKKPVLAGNTAWHNPGNILRISIADHDHKPAVWMCTADKMVLEPIYLKFDKDIFDWTGKRVKSSDSTEAMGGIVQQLSANNKLFITSLKESLNNKFQAENGSELPATQKADLLLEDINTLFELESPPDDVKNMVLYLYDRLKKVNNET